VGACHSGWRGTVDGIVSETVQAMTRLGAVASRMSAFLGPCISTAAFEVGEEVAERFEEAEVERRPEWPRPHVDLRAAIRRQLAAAGVTDVEVDASCTVADARFYSYRGEGGTKGRMLGYVGLRAE
ncbi:MAG: polyphenol oxidase family protein, partial [Bacteroidota bacterium]